MITRPARSKYLLNILLRIVITSAGIILLLWGVIYIYFQSNKRELLAKASKAINNRFQGEFSVRDIGINFVVNFPNVTLRLDDVVLRDSLFRQHQRPLLKAKKVFFSSTVFGLLSGSIKPSQIRIENGNLFLFTNANGYSNRYVLSSKQPSSSRSSYSSLPKGIKLKNVRLMMYDQVKRKYHNLYVQKLACDMSMSGGNLVIDTKLEMDVQSLAFNLQKGSYARNKSIRGKIDMNFDTLTKLLSFNNEKLRIGGQPLIISAAFHFDSTKNFELNFTANRIPFRAVAGLLNDTINKGLDSFDFAKPVNIKASVKGRTAYRDTPVVTASMVVKKNSLRTVNGTFDDCSFTAAFTNQASDTLTRDARNSAITITALRTKWENIPLVSERMLIVDLKHPVITCDIQSNTPLSVIDTAIGSESFEFVKGDARTMIYYHGPLGDSAKVTPYISGSFSISDAEIRYLPRNITMTNFSGDIVFDTTDIRFKSFKGKVQGHSIEINGEVKNVFALMDIDPGKLELNSVVKMPVLDLYEFRSMLGARKRSGSVKRKAKLQRIARGIDRFMDQVNMTTSLHAGRVSYRKFEASDVNAVVKLRNELWQFSNVSLRHADGTFNLDGAVNTSSGSNQMNFDARLSNINISKLFEAFGNFGLDDISSQNIRGSLTTRIQVSGLLNEQAALLPSSLRGTIDLSLKKGELINFEPLQKMSIFLLKKRDFSNLEFAELKNRFEIRGRTLVINKMEVQSTALSMYVEGLYDTKGDSTDLVIQVPLSNLKKRKPDYVPENKGLDAKKGMSVFVRAKSGKGDEIDFKIGLFRKRSVLEKRKDEERKKEPKS